jgi:hypothetical protein
VPPEEGPSDDVLIAGCVVPPPGVEEEIGAGVDACAVTVIVLVA